MIYQRYCETIKCTYLLSFQTQQSYRFFWNKNYKNYVETGKKEQLEPKIENYTKS